LLALIWIETNKNLFSALKFGEVYEHLIYLLAEIYYIPYLHAYMDVFMVSFSAFIIALIKMMIRVARLIPNS